MRPIVSHPRSNVPSRLSSVGCFLKLASSEKYITNLTSGESICLHSEWDIFRQKTEIEWQQKVFPHRGIEPRPQPWKGHILTDRLVRKLTGRHRNITTYIPIQITTQKLSILNSVLRFQVVLSLFDLIVGWTKAWNRSPDCPAEKRRGDKSWTKASPAVRIRKSSFGVTCVPEWLNK